MQANPTQKVNEISAQLSAALLLKDQLTEQLEQTCERVKALRNLMAGVDLGRQQAAEQYDLSKAGSE